MAGRYRRTAHGQWTAVLVGGDSFRLASERVTRAELVDGDTLTIGDTRYVFKSARS